MGHLPDGRVEVALSQPGLLRPLSPGELSDGTLRYLLLVAALKTTRPPGLLVLNEPETSLHRALLPALAGLISDAAQSTQVLVVTHAPELIEGLPAHVRAARADGDTAARCSGGRSARVRAGFWTTR